MSTSRNDVSSYETVTNYVNVYETGIFNSSGVGYDGENTACSVNAVEKTGQLHAKESN